MGANTQQTDRVNRGVIEFDEAAPDAFIDLLIETVEQSAFIETEWVPNPASGDDLLAIYETEGPDGWSDDPDHLQQLCRADRLLDDALDPDTDDPWWMIDEAHDEIEAARRRVEGEA